MAGDRSTVCPALLGYRVSEKTLVIVFEAVNQIIKFCLNELQNYLGVLKRSFLNFKSTDNFLALYFHLRFYGQNQKGAFNETPFISPVLSANKRTRND